MGKPEVLDEFDSEKWAALYSDMLGVDPVLVVGRAVIEAVLAQRLVRARQSTRPRCWVSVNGMLYWVDHAVLDQMRAAQQKQQGALAGSPPGRIRSLAELQLLLATEKTKRLAS